MARRVHIALVVAVTGVVVLAPSVTAAPEPEPPTTTEATTTTEAMTTTVPPSAPTTTTTATAPAPVGDGTTLPTTTAPRTSTSAPAATTASSTTQAPELAPVPAAAAPIVALIAPTLQVGKGNSLGGRPARPGDEFEYNLSVSCSSIDEDCQNFVFTDTIPPGLVVDVASLPRSLPGPAGARTVSYDPATRELRIAFVEPIDNPVGTGWVAGSNLTFDISVSVPVDTPLETGDVISNTASVTATNGAPAIATSDVIVDVPRVVNPVTSKTWSDASAVAGSGETSTIRLGVRNGSSTSAQVTRLTVTDDTPATWEHLDFTDASVTTFPAGADTAQLLVCTLPGGGCTDAQYTSGPTATSGGALPLPPGVVAGAVTGVRVSFTSSTGGVLPQDTVGGSVNIGTALRDTLRSSGAPLRPTGIIDIPNCASATGTDPVAGVVEGAQGCATYRVLPDTLVLTVGKQFFADTNGNFSPEAGEYAVVGANSPVSAIVSVRNVSPFPISEIVVTEPSATAASEFSKLDVEDLRLAFPPAATNANVVVTYDTGPPTTTDYSSSQTVDITRPAARVTSITVTYSGVDANGDPAIAPNALATVGVHGQLNAGVTDADLPGGTSPGVPNCAGVAGDAGRGDGSGTFAGNACATLAVEPPRTTASGVKSASQTNVPGDQPVTFNLRTSNNGNLPLIDPVISDPPASPDGTPDPSVDNPFTSFRLESASISPASGLPPIVIEVYIPGTGWVPLAGADLPAVVGIRARMTGELTPTRSFDLNVTVVRRPGVADGVALTNCYAATAGGAFTPASPWCAPSITTGAAADSATLNKSIAPATLPVYVPGLPRQNADVTLRVRNTGNLSARSIQITDADAAFFDAVDFVSFGSVTAPAGADRVTIDAFVDGAWVPGAPTAVGSPTLPPGATATQVRGLRFTFTSTSTTNGGNVIVPCTAPSCDGVVDFRVSPRPALVTDPAAPPPATISNTVDGTFATNLNPPGTTTPIPPNSASFALVDGTPRIDVAKGPDNTTLAPGEPGTFDLVVTNNGTANIPDLTVVDDLPAGLAFDETFVGDGGLPYTVVATSLPPDTPPIPVPTFEVIRDPATPERVGQVRWTFGGWDLPPQATVTIEIRVQLEPGVTAGQVVNNTMGAASPVEGLQCTAPDVVVTDGAFGDGSYCTDGANVTARAGASFAARKWVAGSPDLGWWSPRTGAFVPVAGGGCPSLTVGGRTYTSNPCVAITDPGEPFRYILRVVNAGTEPATRMAIIDNFPAAGDTGVLGAPRLTEWDNAPTLLGPAVYDGPGTATIGYASSRPFCTADLVLGGPGCPAGSWGATADPSSVAMRLIATFPTPLEPADGIDLAFSMSTPLQVSQVNDPTIAWNSFAHAEATRLGSGGERILPPIEPIKVGVATAYGTLEVAKAIGENPAGLLVDGLSYTFRYDCVLRDGTTPSASGEVTATPGTPGRVAGIPADSTCRVWETGTNGGIPDATEADPVVVTVGRTAAAAPVVGTVTVTNDFPLGRFEVTKTVTGGVDDAFTGGPYTVAISCSYLGTVLAGFPVDLPLVPDERVGVDAPVGATCTAEETVNGGAAIVTYLPASAGGTSGEAVVPAEIDAVAEVAITNQFAAGALVVDKSVIGAGVPAFSSGPFVFDVVCSYNGVADAFTQTVTIDGSDDGSPVQTAPVTGLPIGAECTVTETDAAGADFTPLPETVTITEIEPDNVTIASFLDPFSAGTISVTKTVDGSAADSAYVAGLTYTVAVECALDRPDGTRQTLYTGELPVTPGTPVTALEADGNPVLFPVGTRCWGRELASGGATTVTIDHDSFENGAVVTPEATGAQNLNIGVTNTYDEAALTVSKIAVNGPSGARYTFSVACTTVDVNGATIGVPLLTGTSPVSLAAGEQAVLGVLQGSRCTVTETPVPSNATVSIVETVATPDTAPTDGTVTLDAAATTAFTNSYPAPGGGGGSGGGGGTGGGRGSRPGGGSGSGGPLPSTGSTPLDVLIVGVGLLGLGVASVAITRRRRAVPSSG